MEPGIMVGDPSGALSRESDGHVGGVDERASVIELDRVVPLAPPNDGAVARRGAVNGR